MVVAYSTLAINEVANLLNAWRTGTSYGKHCNRSK